MTWTCFSSPVSDDYPFAPAVFLWCRFITLHLRGISFTENCRNCCCHNLWLPSGNIRNMNFANPFGGIRVRFISNLPLATIVITTPWFASIMTSLRLFLSPHTEWQRGRHNEMSSSSLIHRVVPHSRHIVGCEVLAGIGFQINSLSRLTTLGTSLLPFCAGN